jgi:hypothetical protein
VICARTTKLPTRLLSTARAIFERSLSWSRIVSDNGYGEKNATMSELGARHVAELLALRIRRPIADKGLPPAVTRRADLPRLDPKREPFRFLIV